MSVIFWRTFNAAGSEELKIVDSLAVEVGHTGPDPAAAGQTAQHTRLTLYLPSKAQLCHTAVCFRLSELPEHIKYVKDGSSNHADRYLQI